MGQRIGVQRTHPRNDTPPTKTVDCRGWDKEENNIPLLEAQQFFLLAENKRFTEFEITTGNDLETSEILLSVLFCIIEKNAFS